MRYNLLGRYWEQLFSWANDAFKSNFELSSYDKAKTYPSLPREIWQKASIGGSGWKYRWDTSQRFSHCGQELPRGKNGDTAANKCRVSGEAYMVL